MRTRIEDSYRLNQMQQGMLYQHIVDSRPGIDIQQLICHLREPLNIETFKKAWEFVTERHPVLRTRFRWKGLADSHQEVLRAAKLQFEERDWRSLTPEDRQTALNEFLREDRLAGFDLSEAPLSRVTLFRRGEADYTCVWTYHHIVLDGRSRAIIVEEMFAAYKAFLESRDPSLESPALYRDHIQAMGQIDESGAEAYWRDRLSGFRTPTPLTLDGIDSDLLDVPEQLKEATNLARSTTEQLVSVAEQHGLTLNTLFQGAWAIQLSRYSGEQDVLFGALRAGRGGTIDRANSVAGLFINNLPVRTTVDPNAMLIPWLTKLREQALTIRRYEHTSLATVQRWSEVPQNVRLFDSILVFDRSRFERSTQSDTAEGVGRTFELYGNYGYPLTVKGYGESSFVLEIEYDGSRFGPKTIHNMLGHMSTLLESIAANPYQRIADLKLLKPDEQRELVADRQVRRADFPKQDTLESLFSAQVRRSPNRTAVTSGGSSLTYAELDERSGRLANRLRTSGVDTGEFVALCAEPSLDMVVGVLGILKAGGAYVPLDPVYPLARLQYMVTDADTRVLVVQDHLKRRLEGIPGTFVTLGDEVVDETEVQSASALRKIDPDDPAYVIYTSGSSGRPKGVQVSHYNVVRLFQATRERVEIGDQDVWSLFHSLSFDFSVWELWGALLHGGRLVIVPRALKASPQAFHKLLRNQQVTVLSQTPSALRELINEDSKKSEIKLPELRFIILGGEVLDPTMLKPWFDKHGDESPQIINMYGITETTVHVTYRRMRVADTSSGRNMIGESLSDLRLHILDHQMLPVPMGVAGEIYVGGGGVSRGYVNLSDLTAERFVPDPFSTVSEDRLYRTGDVARYLPDGDIEYIGRADSQVQIRGFRVEPGEIEAILAGHSSIRDALVVAHEDETGDRRLVAYLISTNGNSAPVPELRANLQGRLPQHMVPSSYMFIDRFPLTINGKLDHHALPAPDRLRPELEHQYVAPTTSIERSLTAIWSEVLRLEEIGTGDNFFDLGGHSLLILRVHDLVQKHLDRTFPITKAFQYPTIASFAKYLDAGEKHRPNTAVFARAERQRKALRHLSARSR